MLILIDEEFKNLCPPLSNEEREKLENNIIMDGCRDALVIWKEENILIDGHNRYGVCTKNEIQFKTTELSFKTRQEVKSWIIENQLGRRNLTPDKFTYMLGELYLTRRKPKEDNLRQGNSPNRQNDGSGNIAQQIADEYKVNRRTVERAAEYAKAVDKIAENLGEEAKDKILNGDIQTTRAEIIEIAEKGSTEKQAKILDDLEKAEGKTSRVRMKSMELIEEDNDRPHISYNSGENEWYTPEEYIIAAKLVMGWIDLDPASSQQANIIVGANKIFTVDDDGLNQNWSGKVWLNPPYEGRLISLFCDKLIYHFSLSEVTEALILVNNATETEWFYKLIMTSSAVIFPKRRVRFYAPDGRLAAPLQGQSVIYMGCNPDLFLKHFKPFGWGSKL
jgi:hypothetical protein